MKRIKTPGYSSRRTFPYCNWQEQWRNDSKEASRSFSAKCSVTSGSSPTRYCNLIAEVTKTSLKRTCYFGRTRTQSTHPSIHSSILSSIQTHPTTTEEILVKTNLPHNQTPRPPPTPAPPPKPSLINPIPPLINPHIPPITNQLNRVSLPLLRQGMIRSTAFNRILT